MYLLSWNNDIDPSISSTKGFNNDNIKWSVINSEFNIITLFCSTTIFSTVKPPPPLPQFPHSVPSEKLGERVSRPQTNQSPAKCWSWGACRQITKCSASPANAAQFCLVPRNLTRKFKANTAIIFSKVLSSVKTDYSTFDMLGWIS